MLIILGIIENGKLIANGEVYGALVVPYGKVLNHALTPEVKRLLAAGVPVLLCGGRPESLEGEVIAASELPARVRELGLADITVEGDCPLLRHYHTRRNGADVFMFFNEDSIHTARAAVRLPVSGEFVRLRLLEDRIGRDVTEDGCITVELVPGQSEILVFGSESAADLPALPARPAVAATVPLNPVYRIELAHSEDLSAFAFYKETDRLANITSAAELPSFSGIMRYTFELTADRIHTLSALDLGRVGHTAKVFVNGEPAGIRITAPYVFPISHLLRDGRNTITVEVANTLVGKERDRFSQNMPIAPSGLMGPVQLIEYDA